MSASPRLTLPAGLRAVLFDLDGTLVDSYPAIAASVNHVRGLHGLPPLSVAEVTRHVGHGPHHLLDHTVGVGEVDANVAAYRAHHPSVLRSGTTLLPGARAALAALHARGLKLGVCSNKPVDFTRELVAYLGIGDLLDLALGPEDVGRHKPAPDMLLLAMHRLGVRPDETLYVGDMTVDVETARAAGVPVWVVPTGSDSLAALDRAGPDRRLTDLAELAAAAA
ncbi:MAG: HAD-IA family hydrolase [Gemmataceae bacterium]